MSDCIEHWWAVVVGRRNGPKYFLRDVRPGGGPKLFRSRADANTARYEVGNKPDPFRHVVRVSVSTLPRKAGNQ